MRAGRFATAVLSLAVVAAAGSWLSKRKGPPAPRPALDADASATDTGGVAGGPQPPSFGCSHVVPRRAWRFRGGARISATPAGKLVAVHVTSRVPQGFNERFLDADGLPLETEPQTVRSDANGAPIDRFFLRTFRAADRPDHLTGTVGEPLDLVFIAAAPKDATALTFRAFDRETRGYCDYLLTIDEGPEWPPMPSYRVLRLGPPRPRDGGRSTVLVRFEITGLLGDETPEPPLEWHPPPGHPHAGSKAQTQLRALVRDGAPNVFVGELDVFLDDEKRAWIAVAADTRDALPAPAEWAPTKELEDALVVSRGVRDRHSIAGMAAFARGGQVELDRMIAAGLL